MMLPTAFRTDACKGVLRANSLATKNILVPPHKAVARCHLANAGTLSLLSMVSQVSYCKYHAKQQAEEAQTGIT